MPYLLGVITLIILALAVPAIYLALAVAYLILSALVVMLVVRLVAQTIRRCPVACGPSSTISSSP